MKSLRVENLAQGHSATKPGFNVRSAASLASTPSHGKGSTEQPPKAILFFFFFE